MCHALHAPLQCYPQNQNQKYKKMPEFEENQPNPDLHKDSHQYQPSKEKTAQESGQPSSTAPSSNMRGRWKRPTRNAPKTAAKDSSLSSRPSTNSEPEPIRQREERSFSPNEDYETEEIEDEQEPEFEQPEDQDPRPIKETRKHHHTNPRHSREEHSPRSHSYKKNTEEKPFKPTSRKDVFIPKTKQDSERYRRNPSKAKKSSLWKKILSFFGLNKPTKKHPSEHRPHSRSSDSSRGHRSGSQQNRRPYQQRRHPGQHQKHRSGPPHKNDQKSND